MHEPEPAPRAGHAPLFFTLLTLLAIGVSVVLPNFLNAVERGRQKRAMSELRTIGTAVESYQVDHGHIPRLSGSGIAVEALSPLLAPKFVEILPSVDPWGKPYRWSAAGDEYSILSWGKGRRPDPSPAFGATTHFAADIYFTNGGFSQYPEGTMN